MKDLPTSTQNLEEADVTIAPTLLNVPDGSNSHGYTGEIVGLAGKTAGAEKESKCSEHEFGASKDQVNIAKKNENITVSSCSSLENMHARHCNMTADKQQFNTAESDTEMARRAKEEGIVSVVFRGTVTQEGCCRFVSEILKCILYQRQQLPMTYDQLVYSQKKRQDSKADKDVVSGRQVNLADVNERKCEKTLQDLEEVLHQLEVLFSLSTVPRVLLLMGGSLVLPKEIYEINLEALVLESGDQCLRVSSCLRQLFRTLFVADLLSDSRPGRLMPTTVLVLAHRDCGVGWFHPKLRFKVPTSVKKQTIALCTDPCSCRNASTDILDWQEYVWFQAPTTIKGFCN
ncbi:MAD2L1-binding protein isoform X1 [Phyllopteryx taeniolatus]|uniref:MAD2L1-binding protein isoform X1 n=1 Tax=Phyllopteryx taeniolatus TaxID=161469 RepID=UPI002AD2EB76|nr:MAD2L1-binding protein isoform X1 [Phyllopteryx taeniolatus]